MQEDWNIVLSVLESPDSSQVGYQKVFTTSPIKIGRAEDSDFILNDPTVSRTHATLRITNDYSRVFITDTSTHGTSVSGKPVPKGLGSGFTVQSGDTLRLGQSLLRFELNLKQSVQSTFVGKIDRSFLDNSPEPMKVPTPVPVVEDAEPEFAPAAVKTNRTSTFSIVTIIICLLILVYLVFFQ